MAAVLTGRKAVLEFNTNDGTLHAISDFSLTFDRGTVEQELVGQEGNYFTRGAMSIEGSLTCCRFGSSGSDVFLDSIVDGSVIPISGITNSDSAPGIGWFFHSAQVTGYDVSIGDASTITEASIDFTILDPYNYSYSDGWVTDS